MELSPDERRAAAALKVHLVWHQDCFASGSDRDPASVLELFLSAAEADAYAADRRIKAGPESFERFDRTGPEPLLSLYDERLARPETHYLITEEKVRELLSRAR